MDRFWDNHKYHTKSSVSIFKSKVIEGHEVKKKSNRKISGLGGVIPTCFRSGFVNNATNNPKIAIERPKSDKILKSGKDRNYSKKREKWPFFILKMTKIGCFSRNQFELFAHIHFRI